MTGEDDGDEEEPFDPVRVVETLTRHGVEFVLIGGLGAQHHGAQRATSDIDVIASFERENLRRLVGAMRELGARIRANDFDDEEAKAVAPRMLHPDFFRNQPLSTWRTDAGALDVLHDIPDREGARQTYDAVVTRAIRARYGPVVIRVAALDDIIASKEYADRDKDREALPELHALAEQPPTQRRPAPDRPRSGGHSNGLDPPAGYRQPGPSTEREF